MTPEEARAEEEEARRLLAEIDRLQRQIERAYIENQNLQVELDTLIQNINILADNTAAMDVEVNKSMAYISNRIEEADVSTADLFALIDDLTNSYFTFKNLSTASKNVTQFTDEYYTRFKFFNELRRITLGYVIGLDAHICSDQTMRKKVEEVYLQNTEYWLAYAIMSVMLWASDEEEAAKRAMSKALTMDYYSCSLFYLLINLRFTRVDAAKKWYLTYLDRVDMENLGNEWQYLLQTYLSGVFGVDQEFNSLVHQYLTNLLEQMEAMHPNYGNKVADKTLDFSNSYIHITENEYETLRRNEIHSENRPQDLSEEVDSVSAAELSEAEEVSEVRPIDEMDKWLEDINPNFDPFDINSPYCNNCGSCAYAVYQRLEGNNEICATAENIGYNEQMEALTGMEQVSMSPQEIEARLLEQGDGAHAIIGIDRVTGPGHWFNAANIGGKVVAIDGQSGEITDWPPDYGNVKNWEMSIKKEIEEV